MNRMKIIIVIAALLLNSSVVFSQQAEESKTMAPLPKATDIANHLRTNYGMTKAAYLTQMAWKFSHSFASTEQLTQQWLQAIDTEVQEYQQFNHINSHALMAQVMIQYSNGMNLNQWRFDDLISPPQLPNITEGLTPDQVFQIWLNLPYYWQQIIQLQIQQNNQWLSLPEDLLVFKPTQKPVSQELTALTLVLNWLAKPNSDVKSQLAKTDQQINHYDNLSIALIRQHHHSLQDKHLAFIYDWIEIYQLLELSPNLLAAEEQKNLQLITDHALSQLEASMDVVNAIDENLYKLAHTLLEELPKKFKDPDHLLPSLNKQLFSMIFAIPDMDSYMSHPIRKTTQERLEVCLNVSVSQPPEPNVPIEDNQFESCFNDFINWANTTATSASLSGEKLRVDNAISLHRALELPAFQIINILTMHATNEVNCQQQVATHANLFEWLLASESLAWFHDRWPGIFAEQNKSRQFSQLIEQGYNNNKYPNCLIETQPMAVNFTLLKNKWEKLKQEITAQVNDYAKSELSPGNDINLFGSVEQKTNHVPLDLMVKPCDVSQSCAAKIEMPSSHELMSLFPNHLKLASQFGIGKLEICYDQVGWQNRKTVPTHLDNNKIANFEGQLSIQLNGLFANSKVFSTQLISEQRQIYLFGENIDATLAMECPLPIIGKQINTSLDRGTYGLLPNRLTFLTAQKADTNTVIKNNWNAWLADISTAQNEVEYLDEMNGLKSQLNDAFLHHVNIIQQQIYRKLISSNPSRSNDSALSKATFEFINQRKLFQHMITGLFPYTYQANSDIRSALSGNQRLIDAEFFKKSFENQINVMDMMNQGDAKFQLYNDIWTNELTQSTGPEHSYVNDTLDELKHINSSNSVLDID